MNETFLLEEVIVSKVIHLSNEAHGLAKQYCKSKGLKMSDWVGALIMDAVSASEPREVPEPVVEPQPVVVEPSNAPKKKKLPSIDDSPQMSTDGTPVYEQPPFWAKQAPAPSHEDAE